MNINHIEKVHNVSFIVIAHNEEFAIKKCLESITRMTLENCEVICIDSGSSDKTLEIIESFIGQIENYKIIKISGHQNASIARNAGIENTSKDLDFVFFVDGDVELSSEFIVTSLRKIKNNEADALIGILKENQYAEGYSKVIKKINNRTSITKEETRYYSGGIFITTRSVVENIGIFTPSFTRAQDFDYTLRLSMKYILKAIPTVMGTHHTIPYSNRSRLINEFKKMMPVFYGKVIRNNIDNKKGCYQFINRNGYTKSVPVIFMAVYSVFNTYALIPVVIILLVDMLVGFKKKQSLILRFLSHYLVPFYFVYGLLFAPSLQGKCQNRTNILILKNQD